MPDTDQRITLRLGSSADEERVRALAMLDGAELPPAPVLLAEVDGQLVAALALGEGIAVADPFHRTADLIALLRARADQLDGTSQRRGQLRGVGRRRQGAGPRSTKLRSALRTGWP